MEKNECLAYEWWSAALEIRCAVICRTVCRKGYAAVVITVRIHCSRAVLRESCVATLTKRTDQVFFPVLDSILRVGIRPQHERVMHTVYPSHSATLRGNVCRGIKLQTGCASTSRSSSAVSTPLPPSQLTGCHMLYGLWLAALEHQRLKRRTYEG